MNTRLALAAAAALTLAACTGGEPTAVQTRAPAPPRATGEPNAVVTIFQTLAPTTRFTPDSSLEYGIRFKSAISGTVVGFRVYTYGPGTYTLRLRLDAGTQKASGTLTTTDAGGWKLVALSTPSYHLSANTYYRVSVRTSADLGTTAGFFTGGPFTNGDLTASHGFTYNGTFSDGTAAYFADVEFQVDPE